ncbi:hypothetical protein SMICM304S_06231 [Streptomyces microflavus]
MAAQDAHDLSGGEPRTADVGRLLRCAAVFLPGQVPREGRIAFWDPHADAEAAFADGSSFAYADGAYADDRAPADAVPYSPAELTVVRRDARQGGAPAPGKPGVRSVEVPAALLSLADALPVLVRARHLASAHAATRCWGAAALHALHLVARGRLLPGLTAGGHDAWRAGPRDAEDIAHLRATAAALPPEGYAVPLPGLDPPRLPDPEALIGSFLDAVADTLPRTPAAAFAMGAPFAAREPQHLPHAAAWAVEVASGLDAGVRVSLRLDLSAYELFDTADTYALTASRYGRGRQRGGGRAARPAGPPLPAPPQEVRPRHRPRAAAQDGDRPPRLPHAGSRPRCTRRPCARRWRRSRGPTGIARRGLVMKLLASLKQVCNHPAQYLKEEPTRLTGRSGKLALLDELLDTILSEDSSVLIFTQYVTMAKLLSAHLASRAIPSQLLHGGTPVPERERMVDRFQSAEVPVFLLSLKAAGTGLNLTRAAHVIHYDRWWNPAVEEQATDRAYRIGQTQPVQVHRLIAEGTVEDRIAELLESKRALADAVLSTGETALTELSDRDLADLVSLRRPA